MSAKESAGLIDLVVFDMAGTTVKDDGSVVATALKKAVEANGGSASIDTVNCAMGLPKPVALKALMPGATDEAIDNAHVDFVDIMVAHYRSNVEEIPGAGSVFWQLRRAGIKVALDTGFSRPIADAILEGLDWSTKVNLDAVVTSDEVPRGRPHGDLILAAMRRTGVGDPKRVAKVGDTAVDIRSGRAAKCGMVVGVLSGTGTAAEMFELPCTVVISDVTVVPALVLRFY